MRIDLDQTEIKIILSWYGAAKSEFSECWDGFHKDRNLARKLKTYLPKNRTSKPKKRIRR